MIFGSRPHRQAAVRVPVLSAVCREADFLEAAVQQRCFGVEETDASGDRFRQLALLAPSRAHAIVGDV
ncbi:hypothetical protein PUN4_410087 [Paraburkholderia unamae]|nr:hypothetical protein PUN4_410087 [Paraburkholderia unamae]